MTTPAIKIAVRAKPRAKVTAILAVTEAGPLAADVALAAAPVEGAANEELVRVLAQALGVPKSAISVCMGARGKQKVVEVAGVALEEARARLREAQRR